MWSFLKENGLFFLTIVGKKAVDPLTKKEFNEVVDVSRGRTKDEILVKFRESKNGRRLLRRLFESTDDELKDLIETDSNKQFIDKMNGLLGKEIVNRKRKNQDRETFWQEGDIDKRQRNYEETAEKQEIMSKYIGEKRLRVEQLVQPPPCFRLREVSEAWVVRLTASLLYSALQSTILPVMVIDEATEMEDEMEDVETQVYWILGGNHLVSAMKSLEKNQTIVCHVYRGLTKEEAMCVSANHNRKNKSLPITFQDRVAIARKFHEEGHNDVGKRLKEVLGEIEHKEIKDSVSTIVSVARYTPENYCRFRQLAEEAGEKSIHQKLFKLLQAEGEGLVRDSLEVAIDKGLANACQWLTEEKNKSALRRIFTREVGASSWEEAVLEHPARSNELMKFKGTIKETKKYVPAKVLTFCRDSNLTDQVKKYEVDILVRSGGKNVTLNNKLKHMVEQFKDKVMKELINEGCEIEEEEVCEE